METIHQLNHSREVCKVSVLAVKDALYVLSGKWKLPLILTLSTGPQRFKEIQRTLGEITPKILSKELKELETNEFVTRKVVTSRPVSVLYELTPYSRSLDKVLEELRNWGLEHRERIMHPRNIGSEDTPNEISGEDNISTIFQH